MVTVVKYICSVIDIWRKILIWKLNKSLYRRIVAVDVKMFIRFYILPTISDFCCSKYPWIIMILRLCSAVFLFLKHIYLISSRPLPNIWICLYLKSFLCTHLEVYSDLSWFEEVLWTFMEVYGPSSIEVEHIRRPSWTRDAPYRLKSPDSDLSLADLYDTWPVIGGIVWARRQMWGLWKM